jgi:hypothetical protein
MKVASLTPHPFYPWFPLDRRLDGPQTQSGHWCREKSVVPSGNRTPAVQPGVRFAVLAEERSWLKHHATSRQLAGSIPDEVIGFLQLT